MAQERQQSERRQTASEAHGDMPAAPLGGSLSEIGHLFLSGVRERQTNGAPPPRRRPPGQRDENSPMGPGAEANAARSVDLTPEELAQVSEENPARRRPPVSAVIGAHLNGKQFDRVKQFARHLASEGERVGLIEVDASEFRLLCFEECDPLDESCTCQGKSHADGMDESYARAFDARQMIGALEEMSCDIDRWLLLLPHPRTPEARRLLRLTQQWVLLSTCDHDGVISAYRTLKGLADIHDASTRPALSLALLDARQADLCATVQRKLAAVCDEFLNWPLCEPILIRPAPQVEEHLIMCSRPMGDRGMSGVQWQVMEEFLAQRQAASAPTPKSRDVAMARPDEAEADLNRRLVADFVLPSAAKPTPVSAESPALPAGPLPEVIELSDTTPESILSAVLRGDPLGLIECPVRAPMCGEARLAISRDRRLILVAVVRQGLADLRDIALAYRWLIENRALIGMALPQLAIDAHQHPHLRLLVNHADIRAEVLTPLLESGSVTLLPYRKLKWGEKTGLLLEAA